MFRLYHASLTAALFSLILCAMPARAEDMTSGVPSDQSATSAADRQGKVAKEASDDDFFSWINKMVEPTAADQKKPHMRLQGSGDKGGKDHSDKGHGGGSHK